MAKRINCVLLVLSLSLNSGHDEIGEGGPRNTLTSIPETTILKCCFPNGSREPTWSKYTDHGHKRRICINELCPDNSNYKIDTRVPGCYNLVINSSSESDSTLYECSDGKGHTAAAYVAKYNCSINISNEDGLVVGDVVTFQCNITSHNKPKFKAYWKFENGTIVNGIHSYENQNQYQSTLTVTANHPELPQYTWTLEFLISSVGDEKIDMSTPTATWTSERIKVAYPVTNVRTDCIDGACERVLGDSIRCLADGFPSPDFSWLNEDGVEIHRGPMLKLNSPEPQKYKCVAKNLIRGTPCTESVVVKVFIRETERHTYADSNTTRYFLYVVILVLVLVGLCMWNAKVRNLWRKIKRWCSKKSSSSVEISADGEPLLAVQMVELRANNNANPSNDDSGRLQEESSDNKPKAKTSRINPDKDDDYYDGISENCQGQVDKCQQDENSKENGDSPSTTAQLHFPTEVASDIPVVEDNLPHHSPPPPSPPHAVPGSV